MASRTPSPCSHSENPCGGDGGSPSPRRRDPAARCRRGMTESGGSVAAHLVRRQGQQGRWARTHTGVRWRRGALGRGKRTIELERRNIFAGPLSRQKMWRRRYCRLLRDVCSHSFFYFHLKRKTLRRSLKNRSFQALLMLCRRRGGRVSPHEASRWAFSSPPLARAERFVVGSVSSHAAARISPAPAAVSAVRVSLAGFQALSPLLASYSRLRTPSMPPAPFHWAVLVTSPGDSFLYDFVPLSPRDPATILRLGLGGGAPAVARTSHLRGSGTGRERDDSLASHDWWKDGGGGEPSYRRTSLGKTLMPAEEAILVASHFQTAWPTVLSLASLNCIDHCDALVETLTGRRKAVSLLARPRKSS